MKQQMYTVTPEFKSRAIDILNTKKFSTVFPFMNLINREGFSYTESELNQLVQFMGEFSYSEVSEFFTTLPTLVKKVEESAKTEHTSEMTSIEEPVTETAE